MYDNVLLLLQYSMNDFSQLFAKIRSAGFLSTLQKSGLQEVNTSFWMVLWFIPSIWIRKLCCTRKKIPHILSGGSFVLIFLDIQCSFLHLIVNCQAQVQLLLHHPTTVSIFIQQVNRLFQLGLNNVNNNKQQATTFYDETEYNSSKLNIIEINMFPPSWNTNNSSGCVCITILTIYVTTGWQ